MRVREDNIEGYDLPSDQNVILDVDQGKVVDKEKLTPWQMIQASAKEQNLQLKDPKPDCNHCLGRGYTDIRGGYPYPCHCIFDKKDLENRQVFINRKMARRIEKGEDSMKKNDKIQKMKSMGLKQVSSNVYRNKNGKEFSWDEKNFILIKNK